MPRSQLRVEDNGFDDFAVATIWQSRVEIVGYSVACFDRIAVFKRHIAELPSGRGSYVYVIIGYL